MRYPEDTTDHPRHRPWNWPLSLRTAQRVYERIKKGRALSSVSVDLSKGRFGTVEIPLEDFLSGKELAEIIKSREDV